MSKTPERRLSRIARPMAAVLVLVLGACSHGTDSAMVEVAKSLVPPKSEILEITDNGTGLRIEVGDYWAAVRISDGGLGPGLLEAVEGQAAAEGWEERYRCDVGAGVKVGYSRDTFKVDVSVRTKKEPVDGFISIQRIGDGNTWPPAC